MPNKHASIKDLRKSAKREKANARMKTHLKALTKKLDELAKLGKADEMIAVARQLQQAAAKAAKTKVIHANKAGRKISAAMRKARSNK